ncbi:unnamed protein product [Effrenium voratum]|uniref:Uncharacterized protein n=1 Tax=Effrenium voratum TaxID=2562239 RepID=A0AA36IDC0_9DINO|nr:unnamed protein product [Effrenium voratum]CAJ1442428.1 unnamed protein product [Effrenium voratum]
MSPAQLFARRGPLSYDQLARTGRPSGLRLGKLRTEDARRELEALRGQRLQLELGLSFFEAKARLGAVLAAAKLSAAKAATAKPRRFRRHRGSAMAEPLALPAAPCCRRLLHLAGKELGMDTEGEGFETLVNGLARVYTPGAGLPRHVDHEMFQEPVLAMVLQAAPGDGLRLCQAEHIIAEAGGGAPALRAVLRAEPGFRVQEEDGLLICLEKAARYDLAHEVPAVSSQRISLTWRWFRPEFLEQLQRMEMQLGDAGSGVLSTAPALMGQAAGQKNMASSRTSVRHLKKLRPFSRRPSERRSNAATSTSGRDTGRCACSAGQHSEGIATCKRKDVRCSMLQS